MHTIFKQQWHTPNKHQESVSLIFLCCSCFYFLLIPIHTALLLQLSLITTYSSLYLNLLCILRHSTKLKVSFLVRTFIHALSPYLVFFQRGARFSSSKAYTLSSSSLSFLSSFFPPHYFSLSQSVRIEEQSRTVLFVVRQQLQQVCCDSLSSSLSKHILLLRHNGEITSQQRQQHLFYNNKSISRNQHQYCLCVHLKHIHFSWTLKLWTFFRSFLFVPECVST